MKLGDYISLGGPGSGNTTNHPARGGNIYHKVYPGYPDLRGPGPRDPAPIIMQHRMARARKLAGMLIKYKIGYHQAKTMKDEHWEQLAKAAGIHAPDADSPTRAYTLGLLQRRWKVKQV